MTKRAPGFASAARRLSAVGAACARRSARPTPANRAATSVRLRATIWASTSAIADGDQGFEAFVGRARGQGVERERGTFAQARGLAGGKQKGARVDRYRLLLGAGAIALQQR